jgi:hypothetical protein
MLIKRAECRRPLRRVRAREDQWARAAAMDGVREMADRPDPEMLSFIPDCPDVYSDLIGHTDPIWSMTKADLEQ